MAWIPGTRGVLLDIDGTLMVHDAAVPGVAELLPRLRRSHVRFRLTTNTTRRSRAQIALTLSRAGIEVQADEVISPSVLGRRRIIESGRLSAALLVPDEAQIDFDGIVRDPVQPDWVVVGDLGRDFTWDRLNTAFRQIDGGATLLALQKNRFWLTPSGRTLDAGPFVAALEYASGVAAEAVGKPTPAFYSLALEELGLPPSDVLVVGDDWENDGAAGAHAGCRTALVRTGKFSLGRHLQSVFEPDLVLESAAGLVP